MIESATLFNRFCDYNSGNKVRRLSAYVSFYPSIACGPNLFMKWIFEQGSGEYVYIRDRSKKYWNIANSPENGERIVVGSNKQNWEIRKDTKDLTQFR